MRYGVPYNGSKNKIAKWIIDHIPPAEIFVDIFAGGCAVTHAAMLSGKYQRFIVNDLNPTPQLFIDAINGELEGYSTVPTKEEFHKLKGVDEAIAILYSFGNGRENYLYGEKYEAIKIPAQKMLTAPSLYERRIAYRQFIKALQEYLQNSGNLKDLQNLEGIQHLQSLKRLQQLQGLQSLERLQQLQGLQSLERLQQLQGLQSDYTQIKIPENAIVYADPPYKGMDCRGYAHSKDFNYERFAEWLANAPLTIVSEYTCPDGCIEIASIDKRVQASQYDKNAYNTERLFVHKRHLEEYQERMKELAVI